MMAKEADLQYTRVVFPEYREGELSNRIRTLVMHWDGGNLASLEIAFPAGSSRDPKGKEGLAYFASKILSGNLELAKELEKLGVTLETNVGRDGFYIEMTGIAPSFENGVRLLKDLLLNPEFSEEDFRRQKFAQLGELAYNGANPSWIAKTSFYKAYFGEHPYAHPPLGTETGVQAITTEDVKNFFAKHLKPSEGVVAVLLAPFSLEKQEQLLKDSIGSLGGAAEEEVLISEAPSPEPQIFIVPSPEANQAQIVMGHQGVSATNPDRFRIALMNAILGGNAFSSRLFERVRVQEGLTYSIRSNFEAFKKTGLFLVQTFTRTEETPRMISLVKELVSRMQTDPPSEQELLDTKSSLVLGYPLKVQTIGSVTDRFTDTLFYRLPLSDTLDYQAHINEVTKEDVLQAAQSYLYPERFMGIVVGQPDPLQKALEPLKPVIMPTRNVQP